MADNINIRDANGNSKPIRTDEKTADGSHMQVFKMAFGGDGVEQFVTLGQQTSGSSVPVVLTAEQLSALTSGSMAAIGTTTDEAANYGVEEDATARTGIGLWKGIKNILQYINDKLGGALIIAADGDGNPVTLSGYGDGSYNGLYVYDMCEIGQKFAAIAVSGSGNNTIVAAVADKKIRVFALTLSFSGAVNAKFQSGAGGTDKTGLYYGTTNTAIVLPYNKFGWFETAAGALLNLNLSGAVAVGGCLTYTEV